MRALVARHLTLGWSGLLVLATATHQQVAGTVLAYHALWHIVGGFGFVVLLVFNHVRFEARRVQTAGSPA